MGLGRVLLFLAVAFPFAPPAAAAVEMGFHRVSQDGLDLLTS
uniref:Isoform 3 of MHC class I polypeptide-related sequence B n=1 Tax=Homo sapiens TaxID=9606 RepID=Q29980-3